MKIQFKGKEIKSVIQNGAQTTEDFRWNSIYRLSYMKLSKYHKSENLWTSSVNNKTSRNLKGVISSQIFRVPGAQKGFV